MTNLRKLARGQTCKIRVPDVCNHNPETVVLAHYRIVGISGIGMKSPDLLAADACSACHSYCDTHHDQATKLMFLEGVMRTIAARIEDGVVTW